MVLESRRFDRAAPFYDRTRGLPAEAAAQVTELLAGQLTGRTPALEIGVGTGQVALPLHDRGVAMVGVDLSRPMMEVLVEKAGGTLPFPLAQADATVLPFPDARFGAVLASHVFHLIPAWRDALTEVRRVIRPGGVFLSSRGGRDAAGPIAAIRTEFQTSLGADARHIGAAHDDRQVEDALVELGASERRLPAVTVTRAVKPETMIASLEAGQWSWAWGLPESRLHAAAEHTRSWAQSRFGSLDEAVTVVAEVHWSAFDLP